MDCFCGCGTRVRRKLIETNLQASTVALELLAWDKARAESRLPPGDIERVDSLVQRGANCYGRLLLVLHGERESAPQESEEWLEESRAERRGRPYMTDKGMTLISREKLRLTEEDQARLDRKHPETSFTGASGKPSEEVGDLAGQVERLGSLHSQGLLTDEEFAAAKARVIGGP